jgi:hypothetical protein
MRLFDLTDEILLAFYESVRRQVRADMNLGSRHRLAGPTVRQYAQRLSRELNRRRVPFKPIEWPDG